MTAETFTVYLADGRQLEVLATGPETGLPLVMHNGTPIGLVAYPPMTEGAATRRPGRGVDSP